jgi:CheY-like chemotaxis protein
MHEIGHRILLVEDDALLAMDTQDVLTDAGYIVIGPAGTVDRALVIAQGAPLSAAVLDVNLHGLDVWPVAEALHNRGIPFVLLTGFGADLEKPPFCARKPHLHKPIIPQTLLSALDQILQSISGPNLMRPRNSDSD